ncbi:MAG: D-alanyl-D-alanine carboxypeptidase, partial [Candidatus Acidiferrum sp.]
LDALRDFLLKAGLKPEEFSFHDGSGLSRWDLVSPAATVRLLQYAAAQPWGFKYMETLPVGGEDGSLAGRYHNAAAQGRIHAKSGSMEHVNTLSGYAEQPDGKTLVFSIMVNNHDVSESTALSAIDQIVEALFPPAAPKRRATKKPH